MEANVLPPDFWRPGSGAKMIEKFLREYPSAYEEHALRYLSCADQPSGNKLSVA